jgi:hypothetical protein
MRQLSFYLFLLFFAVNLLCLEYTESSNGLNYPEFEGGRTEMEFADIDADGNIDILSIGDHGSPYINTDQHGIMVWFGDGNGNWNVYQNGNFGYGGIAVGDVNNDGLLDVGYAMHHDYSSTDFGDQLIEVALGDGTGMNWTPWDDGLATNGETWGMFGTDFADVDNDGDLDIGSNSFGSGAGVHIYLNQSDGSWLQSFGFLGGNSTMDLDFGDINKDGNVDFAVKHQYGTVYFGDGTGNFVLNDANLPSTGTMGRNGTALGDVDNDGGKDLSSTGNYGSTQLYDMNVDGYIDVCAFGYGTFTLWLGDGTGNWTQDAQFYTPPFGYFKAFRVGGDIDHNGFPDIVLVSEEGSWPSYQNHLYCYKETSTVDSLTITPMFPRGNEKFLQNSIQFIDWVSAVPEVDSSLVKLDYSINGNNGPWTTISDSLPNNGRFQWAVPEIGSPNYCIRYTVWTATDIETATTPQSFTVEPYELAYPATDVLAVVNVENTEVLITWNSPMLDERDLESYDVSDWILLEPDFYQYAIVAIYSDGLQAEAAFSNVVEKLPVGVDNELLNLNVILTNYPNPFNPTTTIYFNLTAQTGEDPEISIYNIKGQKIRTLQSLPNGGLGTRSVVWDGTDENNQPVTSGIYFYKLSAGEYTQTRKMLLLK